jgi:hypothetical protein
LARIAYYVELARIKEYHTSFVTPAKLSRLPAIRGRVCIDKVFAVDDRPVVDAVLRCVKKRKVAQRGELKSNNVIHALPT